MLALKNKLLAVCFALLLCGGSTPFAAPYSPKAGSAERKAIMNALRVPVQKRAKQTVVFYGVNLKVEKGWAFVHCVAMDKTGKKYVLGEIDTAGLLRKTNGRWKVLHWGTAGDISVACDAAKKYPKAPRAIFGGVLGGCGKAFVRSMKIKWATIFTFMQKSSVPIIGN